MADNAVNGSRPWVAGVGLISMATRAAELGGQLSAAPTPTGGRVSATLPYERNPQ